MNKEKAGTRPTRLFSDAMLRELDRTLWSYPFSDLTEDRAKRVFTVCAASLLWAAGLVKSGSIKFLDMEIGGSALLITWVALGLVVYTFAQWLVSMRRDQKHVKLSVAGINEALGGEAQTTLAEPKAEFTDAQQRYARYSPKIRKIEEQIAGLNEEYAKPISAAKAKVDGLTLKLSEFLQKPVESLTESEVQSLRTLEDDVEDAMEAKQSLQDDLRSRHDVLAKKQHWYLARSRIKDETLYQIMAILSEKSPDQLERVLRGGKKVTWANLAVEIVPVWIAFVAAFVWLTLNALELSAVNAHPQAPVKPPTTIATPG
jgi:hypothetical protein